MAARRMAALATAGAVLAAVAVAAGCSDDLGPEQAPVGPPATETAFARALARVGSGTIPIGTGYGWIDVDELRDQRTPGRFALDWAARALGPGGSDIVLERDSIRRRTGLEIDRASRLLASAASYTLGVRIDRIDLSSLRPRLRRAASARRRSGGWALFSLGSVSSIPRGTPTEVFGALGARTALGSRSLVLARRGQSRRDLTGAGASPLDDPAVRLAVGCLGDVVAARIVPNNFTHAPNSGPDLLAFGATSPTGGSAREVLCAVDTSAEVAAAAQAAMSTAMAPDAADAVTGESMAAHVSSAEIGGLQRGGAFAARAELELARGTPRGFLFGAFVRGSLITYVGLPAPAATD